MSSRPLRSSPLALALALTLAAPLAWAADPPAAQTDPRHAEPRTLDAVEVTATPLPDTVESLAQPVEVLAGQRLDAAKASTLGETVARLPGVQSSYFGPGVGRPIVRGFDGARVQVLSDGLASGDVSTVSVDHAVAIEPFLADQIEVLKGPATLLYGSGAIGGAVNVVDGRIPEALPDEPFGGRAELRADSGNGGRTGMLRLDGAAGGGFAFHFDALHRETGDVAIPGFAESARLLAAEGETPDPAERGRLPNSALLTDSAALGVSWIGARGFLGASYGLYASAYGIPGHAHAAPDGEDAGEDAVRIRMDQRRSELRAGLDDIGPFPSLRLKFARTTYTHTELEGGAVGTVFDNDGSEGRLELVHRPLAGFDGALGLQWSRRDFAAVGAEAFVPASLSRDAGVFWIGNRAFGAASLQLGARHDRNRIDVDAAAIGPDRRFATTSVSAALKWDIGQALHLSVGLDRAQRPPTAEELYSNGLHVATGSVERGAPGLDPETANRAELGLHWHAGSLALGAALYRVAYDDFIYLAQTGSGPDGIPVRQWTQDDARFRGAEAELEWTVLDNGSGRWELRAFGDVVRAELVDGGNLPRIAPWRAGGELRWERGPLRASLGAVRHARQDRVAPLETPTPGYTLVDAHLAWHVDSAGGNAWEMFLDGGNLLDTEARAHTSFLKDLAPLPGRNLAAGVRVYF